MIYLVWAMTKNFVIGDQEKMPWKIREEMEYFKTLTTNKTVLMGSTTFNSIGCPLKNRKNIIITTKPENYQYLVSKGCIISNDLISILKNYQKNDHNDLYVIGGAKIYQQCFHFADFLAISIINDNYHGNIKFPVTDYSKFKIIKKTKYNAFCAYLYQRKEY